MDRGGRVQGEQGAQIMRRPVASGLRGAGVQSPTPAPVHLCVRATHLYAHLPFTLFSLVMFEQEDPVS